MVAVGDGPSALAALDDSCPEVALIDIGLPGMDGYELARALRRRLAATALFLVALTGFGRTADREAARAASFDAHVTKPLKPRELFRLLQQAAVKH